MLIVLPSKRIAVLPFQRLLDDQPRRQPHDQRAPSGDDRRPSIKSESDWRVRTDPGSLHDMGRSLLAPPATGVGFGILSEDAPQPKFPASLGLHLIAGC